MDTKQTITRIVLFVVIIGAIIAGMSLFVGRGNTSTKYDQFTQCLQDNGVKFYGAFWCPHCQDLKRDLGASVKKLEYIECSTPDGAAQTEVCKAANIQSYPTLEFKDGTRITGYTDSRDLVAIGAKANCALPTDEK